jgi:hypothetical protein
MRAGKRNDIFSEDFRHAVKRPTSLSARPEPGEAEDMNARSLHPSVRKDGAAALFDAASRQEVLPAAADRSCCCVAKAVVRVVMPPTRARPHETELLLCGHHYRVSRQALAAAHASVVQLPGIPVDTTAWIDGDRDPSPTPVG